MQGRPDPLHQCHSSFAQPVPGIVVLQIMFKQVENAFLECTCHSYE